MSGQEDKNTQTLSTDDSAEENMEAESAQNREKRKKLLMGGIAIAALLCLFVVGMAHEKMKSSAADEGETIMMEAAQIKETTAAEHAVQAEEDARSAAEETGPADNAREAAAEPDAGEGKSTAKEEEPKEEEPKDEEPKDEEPKDEEAERKALQANSASSAAPAVELPEGEEEDTSPAAQKEAAEAEKKQAIEEEAKKAQKAAPVLTPSVKQDDGCIGDDALVW